MHHIDPNGRSFTSRKITKLNINEFLELIYAENAAVEFPEDQWRQADGAPIGLYIQMQILHELREIKSLLEQGSFEHVDTFG